MRNPFRGGRPGTRALIALVLALAALVALYGALVLPRASTNAREAASTDAPLAVLASSRETEGGDGCSRYGEEQIGDDAVTVRPVAY